MNIDTLNYIRTHKNLYRLLRDDSKYYCLIFNNPNIIYELNKIAKEKYSNRYIDKINKLEKKINILSSLLDVFN